MGVETATQCGITTHIFKMTLRASKYPYLLFIISLWGTLAYTAIYGFPIWVPYT